MILHIIYNGDTSVGIFPSSFSIDVPFNNDDVDEETLKWFKDEQIKLYNEFAEGKLYAFYDYENY